MTIPLIYRLTQTVTVLYTCTLYIVHEERLGNIFRELRKPGSHPGHVPYTCTFILSSSFILCSFPFGTKTRGGPASSAPPPFCFPPWRRRARKREREREREREGGGGDEEQRKKARMKTCMYMYIVTVRHNHMTVTCTTYTYMYM